MDPLTAFTLIRFGSFCIRSVVWLIACVGHMIDPLPSEPPAPPAPQQVHNTPAVPGAEFAQTQRYQRDDAAEAAIAAATVIVNDSCSGVCVDPRGYVLTARHCQPPKQSTVTFADSGQHPAVVLYVGQGGCDGAVLLKVEGGPFPFLPVSDTEPMKEAAIRNAGYQAAAQENFVCLSGKLLGRSTSMMHVDAARKQMYALSTAAMGGMSGGPVVTDSGQVFSLNCETDSHMAFGVSLQSLRDATALIPAQSQAQWEPQPTLAAQLHLEIWTTERCPACVPVKRDFTDRTFTAAIFATYDVEFYDGDALENQDGLRARGITEFPSFVIRETKRVWSGYGGREDMLQRLGIEQVQSFAPPGKQEPAPQHTYPDTPPGFGVVVEPDLQQNAKTPPPEISADAPPADTSRLERILVLFGLGGLAGLGATFWRLHALAKVLTGDSGPLEKIRAMSKMKRELADLKNQVSSLRGKPSSILE